MLSSEREEITGAFDALDASLDAVLGLHFDALSTRERLALLERCERARRRIPAAEHPLINQLAGQATPEELGGKLSHAIAEWTLISRAEASRRAREAADLGARRALTGQPLAPIMAATAAGQRAGKLGARASRGDPPVLPPTARLDRHADSRTRRSRPGPPRHPTPPRNPGRTGRHPRRLPQPRPSPR